MTDDIQRAVSAVRREWRRARVDERDIATMSADLRLDLTAAAAEGATPDQLIGADVRAFAQRLADAADVRRTPDEYARLVRAVLRGAAPTLMLWWLLAWFPLPMVHPANPVFGLLAIWFALRRVGRDLRDVPRIRHTIRLTWLLALPAALVAGPFIVAYAYLAGFSASPPIMLIELGMGTAVLAGTVVVARWWDIRRSLAVEQAEDQLAR